AERVQRFKQEARTASALNHPNIITIYEIGEVEDRLFIATEYIEGETLREKIEKNDLSVDESVRIAEQVATALSVAHQASIIHRDIKRRRDARRAAQTRADKSARSPQRGRASRRRFGRSAHSTDHSPRHQTRQHHRQ
ncbi:MAG: protein kinase, partial [Pyrinomonadaceae bacterium]